MADRPLECSDCKRQIQITYTEIVNGEISQVKCCAECPFVKNRLQQGDSPSEKLQLPFSQPLKCSVCQTTLEEILHGSPLGCTRCYEIFGEMILEALVESDALPVQENSELKKQKTISLHVGLTPETRHESEHDLIEKLEALNASLNEALAFENYEEAAQIRDQIQTLSKRRHAG